LLLIASPASPLIEQMLSESSLRLVLGTDALDRASATRRHPSTEELRNAVATLEDMRRKGI